MKNFSRVFVTALLVVASRIFSCAQTPTTDSMFVSQNYNKHDYQIAMRDGVKLYTTVYVPKDTSELHPILLTRTPYSAGPYGENHIETRWRKITKEYLQRNYILVYQDVRGKYMSEGTFVDVRPYIADKKSKNDIDETSDTYDTVDWLIKNLAHNNGKVGVKGISYPGFYTTMATIDAHPAVVATSPQAPVSQWMGGDDFFHNGALLLPHAFDFFMGFGWQRTAPTENDSHPFNEGTPDEYQFYLKMGALPNANKLYAHDSVAFWNEIAKHGGKWDDWWAARDVLPHVKNLKPATMVVGGWFDTENLYGALHLYGQIKKDNPTGHHALVMGPWPHGWWARNDVDSLGPIKFGMNLSDYFAKNIEVPYFEYYLRGKGTMNLPDAYVFETGANEWRTLDTWPPLNTKIANLYLCKGGKLSFTEPGITTPAFDEYVSDPAKPVPYLGQITHWYDGSFMAADQRFAAERPDVLVYESEILEDSVTVAGPIGVHLTGSSSGTDCDWIVKVIDVFPDSMKDPDPNPLRVKFGGYQMLVRGDVLRGKFHRALAKPEPLTPGKPENFNFNMCDVFHQFKKGHRLMVQVQSTWFPMIDRNPGKFEDIFQAKDSDFVKTTQRVYHSPKNVSFVTLHVVK